MQSQLSMLQWKTQNIESIFTLNATSNWHIAILLPSTIEHVDSKLEGVSETQLHWIDSGQVENPLVILSLNGPMDMWGPESGQTNKMIELDIMLNLGLH